MPFCSQVLHLAEILLYTSIPVKVFFRYLSRFQYIILTYSLKILCTRLLIYCLSDSEAALNISLAIFITHDCCVTSQVKQVVNIFQF